MSRWCTGQELITQFDLQDFELFDLLRKGLQAYTYDGKKVINSDSLPKGRRFSLEFFEGTIRAKLNARVLGGPGTTMRPHPSESEIKQEALLAHNRQLLEILDPPKNCFIFSFTLPDNDKERKNAIITALNFTFKSEDVLKYFSNDRDSLLVNGAIQGKRENFAKVEADNAVKPFTEVVKDQQNINYFRRSGENWLIRYKGEREEKVKRLRGFQYIAYLINEPGKSMSCYDLYHCFNSPGKMTKNEAIDQTLSIASRSIDVEAKNTYKARTNYLQQYNKLQGDLENAKTDLERAEIEKEMAEILAATKEGKFKDSIHANAQSSVIKSLKVAYAELEKNNLKELATHFRDNIKPDGNFGYIYKGITWEVIL